MSSESPNVLRQRMGADSFEALVPHFVETAVQSQYPDRNVRIAAANLRL
jgi:hypothetical protein